MDPMVEDPQEPTKSPSASHRRPGDSSRGSVEDMVRKICKEIEKEKRQARARRSTGASSTDNSASDEEEEIRRGKHKKRKKYEELKDQIRKEVEEERARQEEAKKEKERELQRLANEISKKVDMKIVENRGRRGGRSFPNAPAANLYSTAQHSQPRCASFRDACNLSPSALPVPVPPLPCSSFPLPQVDALSEDMFFCEEPVCQPLALSLQVGHKMVMVYTSQTGEKLHRNSRLICSSRHQQVEKLRRPAQLDCHIERNPQSPGVFRFVDWSVPGATVQKLPGEPGPSVMFKPDGGMVCFPFFVAPQVGCNEIDDCDLVERNPISDIVQTPVHQEVFVECYVPVPVEKPVPDHVEKIVERVVPAHITDTVEVPVEGIVGQVVPQDTIVEMPLNKVERVCPFLVALPQVGPLNSYTDYLSDGSMDPSQPEGVCSTPFLLHCHRWALEWIKMCQTLSYRLSQSQGSYLRP